MIKGWRNNPEMLTYRHCVDMERAARVKMNRVLELQADMQRAMARAAATVRVDVDALLHNAPFESGFDGPLHH